MCIIKVCGIRDRDCAKFCLEEGANALGFVTYEKSPRYISASAVKEILQDSFFSSLNPKALFVGVFVKPDLKYLESYINSGINTVQLHLTVSKELLESISRYFPHLKVIYAFNSKAQIKNLELKNFWAVLFDSYDPKTIGGTGKIADWATAIELRKNLTTRFILAGGLNPNNVSEAIWAVRPDGIDASSGLEKEKGIKDKEKVKNFIKNAKIAFQRIKTEIEKENSFLNNFDDLQI